MQSADRGSGPSKICSDEVLHARLLIAVADVSPKVMTRYGMWPKFEFPDEQVHDQLNLRITLGNKVTTWAISKAVASSGVAPIRDGLTLVIDQAFGSRMTPGRFTEQTYQNREIK